MENDHRLSLSPHSEFLRALATRPHPPNWHQSHLNLKTKNLHLSPNQIVPFCFNISVKREILSKYQKLKQGKEIILLVPLPEGSLSHSVALRWDWRVGNHKFCPLQREA